jgi:hypothetical protein
MLFSLTYTKTHTTLCDITRQPLNKKEVYMKKILLLMTVLCILVIALSLHPLLAQNGNKGGRWDNITDNVTRGVMSVTGGGQVAVGSTDSNNGAHFGMGIVANRQVEGHFMFSDDLDDLQCKPTEVFNTLCGETASFTCSNGYIVEVFAGDPNIPTDRGFLSIFANSTDYNSDPPMAMVEGPVTNGLIRVECRGPLYL